MKGLNYHLHLYEEYLKGRGYSKKSVEVKRYLLSFFTKHLVKHNVRSITEIKASHIYNCKDSFLKQVSHHTKKPYSPRTADRLVSTIKQWCSFLVRFDHILIDPSDEVVISWRHEKQHKDIFSHEEIDSFLSSAETLRDRALFELIYSSGLRVSEVCNLIITDLDFHERMLLVQDGKGGKDRFVPYSQTAAYFLDKYVKKEREKLLLRNRSDKLFVSNRGQGLRPVSVTYLFRKMLSKSGICAGKKLSVHSIRHTTATHLLEAGADVRYVQELLGHELIETTVKYTHLVVDNLKRIYKMYHPRENMYYEEVGSEYYNKCERLKEMICEDREKVDRKQ